MLLDYLCRLLVRLCPPFEAAGFGGAPEAATDGYSDVDCFLLAPDGDLAGLIGSFPGLVEHPEEPIVAWERGWHPGFGYQYVYIYPDSSGIDYFINSAYTLTATAMALKTRLVIDNTGSYSSFLASLNDHRSLSAGAEYSAAAAEYLVELVKVRKYVARRQLLAAAHRLERLRLVLLALERSHARSDRYNPHDADKHIDLGNDLGELIASTFLPLTWPDVHTALEALSRAIVARLTMPGQGLSGRQLSLQAELRHDIGRLLPARER
jgi:hypothetical protein